MDDDVRYVYLEDDEEGVRVWPLEDSAITWKGKPVLTRNDSHVLRAEEEIVGYEAGRPGYHLAALDGPPLENCIVQPWSEEDARIPGGEDSRNLKNAKLGGSEVKFPEGWSKNLRDQASSPKREYVLLAAGTDQERLCWAEGSLPEWVDGAEERRKERERQKEESKLTGLLNKLHNDGDAFINPYTFVPLPERVERCAPSGHAQAVTGALTGYVDVEYTFRTPLMLPGDWRPTDTKHDVLIDIPGSTVRGSTRSLYETLTHSCLHVIDPDYLPVHRSALEDRRQDQLAVVHETKDNRVTGVIPTTEVIWIKAEALKRQLGEELRSGLRFDLAEGSGDWKEYAKRYELKEGKLSTIQKNPQGGWVIHIADTGAKRGDNAYVAVGKLAAEPEAVPAKVWEDFRELCRHSQDVDAGKLAESAPDWDSSEWPGKMVKLKNRDVGRRRKTDGMLAVGDSVWLVRDKAGRTQGLKMSYNWRELGRHPLKDRLPSKSLLPCSDPEDLCPACRVFGFIEQRTSTSSDDSRQHAYGSHIRFLKFRSEKSVKVWSADPPPMRSPRASAGAFYLQHTNTEGGHLRQAGEPQVGKPTSRWGGPLDANPPRRINGRKFYWHGQEPDDTTPTPRHIRRDHYPDAEPGERRWFAPAGTTVKGRVLFENLQPEEVGLLLVALNPQLLTEVVATEKADELATHLGGGKGLGFGSAVATVLEVHLEDAAARYLEDSTGGTVTKETVLRAATDVLTGNQGTVADVAKALGMNSVPKDRIWYPTTGNFEKRQTKDEQKKFDSSFEYYAKFSGGKDKHTRMRTLPSIHDPIQYMSNKPEPDKKERR